MNLNVSERLICTLRGLSRSMDRLTDSIKKTVRERREVNMEMMEEDEPLSSSEAPRAPALDTQKHPSDRHPVSRYVRPHSDRSEMSCLATSTMSEITNLFHPSFGVKESTVAHSFSALLL